MITCKTCGGELYQGPVWDTDDREVIGSDGMPVMTWHHQSLADVVTCPDYAHAQPVDVSATTLALSRSTDEAVRLILGA